MNTRTVQAANAGRKVLGTCDGEGDPGPEGGPGDPREEAGQRGRSLYAAGRSPGSSVDRARDQGCPRGSVGHREGYRHSAPVRRARWCACMCPFACACVPVFVQLHLVAARATPRSLCAAPQHGESRRGSARLGSSHTPGKLIAARLQMKFY